ncbi:NAD-dependent epimerase/dehydratase family protein [Carboxylicivirga mesophila]|uniref:NAD-dependent epimerase/dehydratase family protein n=1 Tax=Carboxylicivirga mesophila TaxID=1166478 RepID=A0ABS5KAU9_9BACT|nr:NAD-dependent epimerase/dehydratase family protein [Carboxylicivirga mesophila]MBS2212012.1 NAD-dependent epimerase/dehydratase family protein [Carboxylicivirga mesophila]
MKTALIAGASGLVGQSLLLQLLHSDQYSKIIALVRRPSLGNHPKLKEEVINFEDLGSYESPHNVDDVFCCLGTTIKTAGSQEAFRKVDFTYVIELAKWAENKHCQQFAAISSVGASTNTSNFYLRTKGEMEAAISTLNIPAIHIFRPSLLLGQRDEFRFGEKVSEIMMRLFNPMMKGRLRKYKAIEASDVAMAMYNKTQHSIDGVIIYEGAEIG